MWMLCLCVFHFLTVTVLTVLFACALVQFNFCTSHVLGLKVLRCLVTRLQMTYGHLCFFKIFDPDDFVGRTFLLKKEGGQCLRDRVVKSLDYFEGNLARD